MIVYQTDDNGVYLHETTADRSPLGDGWLIPAGCVETKPPEAGANQVAQWHNGAWRVLADWRGTSVWHAETGSPQKWQELGDLPDGYTLLPRPSAYHTLQNGVWTISPEQQAQQRADAQAQVWERIKQRREQNTHGGVQVGDKWYHTDQNSRVQYVALLALPKMPDNLQWKTMDGSFVAMDKAQLTKLMAALMAHETADFANAEKHRAAMMQAENPLDYDFSGGWSEIYAA